MMGEITDKPFTQEPDAVCPLQFSTSREDRLTVYSSTRHQSKIQRPTGLSLQLPLTGIAAGPRTNCNNNNNNNHLVNETPTPTTRLYNNLLKSLEDSGITTLNDLKANSPVKSNHDLNTANCYGIGDDAIARAHGNENPFVKTFVEAAVSLRKGGKLKIHEPLVNNNDNNDCDESLNTPSIELDSLMGPRNHELNLISTIPDTPDIMKATTPFIINSNCDRLSPTDSANQISSLVANQDSPPESNSMSGQDKEETGSKINGSRAGEVKSTGSTKSPLNLVTSTTHQVMSTQSTQKQVLLLPKINKPDDSSTMSPRPLYSLVLKLPIAGNDSVQTPLVNTVGTSKANISASFSHSQSQSSCSSSSTSSTGQAANKKLFCSSSAATTSSTTLYQNNGGKSTAKMARRTVSEAQSDSSQSTYATLDSRPSSQSDTGSEQLSSQPSSQPKAKPGRKSKSAPEEDPRERKVRSLERNRAAAMRCREKRKIALKALEDNADEMQKLNDRLQVQVGILRRKVTELKTALLAHKDCPVTLQQLRRPGSDETCFPIALHS